MGKHKYARKLIWQPIPKAFEIQVFRVRQFLFLARSDDAAWQAPRKGVSAANTWSGWAERRGQGQKGACSGGLNLKRFGYIGRLLPVLLSVGALPAQADIYFNAKVLGPVTNIYSIDAGGKIKKHTDNIRWRDLEPTLSPAGELAFVSNREPQGGIDLHKKSETFNLFTLTAPGVPNQITADPEPEGRPRFSPGGDKLAYLRIDSGRRQLRILARKNSQTTGWKNLRTLAVSGSILDYGWSADGERIAYASLEKKGSSLNIVALQTGRITTLRSAEAGRKERIVSLNWSPRGDNIAFITHPPSAQKNRRLHILDLRTGAEKTISPPGVQMQSPPSWSGDGQHLLYAALVDYAFHYDEKNHRKVYRGGMHIFSADLEGNNRQLTRGGHLFRHPVYSPDEKRIAFLYADKLGGARTLSLRTMKTDGSDIQQLYDSVSPYSTLIWR